MERGGFRKKLVCLLILLLDLVGVLRIGEISEPRVRFKSHCISSLLDLRSQDVK